MPPALAFANQDGETFRILAVVSTSRRAVELIKVAHRSGSAARSPGRCFDAARLTKRANGYELRRFAELLDLHRLDTSPKVVCQDHNIARLSDGICRSVETKDPRVVWYIPRVGVLDFKPSPSPVRWWPEVVPEKGLERDFRTGKSFAIFFRISRNFSAPLNGAAPSSILETIRRAGLLFGKACHHNPIRPLLTIFARVNRLP